MSAAPALYVKHEALALALSTGWRLPGADADDVRQEARIALWEAARCYDATLGVPFTAFARLVIARRLRDALRRYGQRRHQMLTDAERDTSEIPTTHADILERRQELRQLVIAFHALSPLEQKAILTSANGTPCSEVGELKSVDNATQRGRQKLRRALAA